MRVEDKIKELIEEQGLTVKSFAEKNNIPYTTLRSTLERGINKSSVDVVIKIADGLNLSIDALADNRIERARLVQDLMLVSENNEKYSNSLKRRIYFDKDLFDIYSIKQSKYPFVPCSVSAGMPLEIEGYQELPSITLPKSFLGKYSEREDLVIMSVNGDSMDKIIPDRSYIALITNIELSEIHDGDIVVFKYENDFSLKHFFDLGDEVLFRPNSTNIHHQDIRLIKDNNLQIIGKVVMYNIVLD